jgi:phosphoribosylamine--glycine ligase
VTKVGAPIVVKADGLHAGKGVIVAMTAEEALRAVDQVFAMGPDAPVVIEEFLEGEEASFFCLVDGETVAPLASAQDHKRVFDGDRGPNTGGMGATSPVPAVDERLGSQVMERILRPTVRALAAEGRPYRGLLYAGLMITPAGPRVVEFNCRFGDPECQVVLVRLEDDLLALLDACARGQALPALARWSPRAAVCVVLASGGYPAGYETGFPIGGLERAEAIPDLLVFQAGTATENGILVTAGGRVLGVTAVAETIQGAADLAYRGIDRISFEGMHFRRDIGRKP